MYYGFDELQHGPEAMAETILATRAS
jgi:hypothetical protein